MDRQSVRQSEWQNEEGFLTAQLRKSAPYLIDAGFRETATLVKAAADEIDLLRSLLRKSMPDSDLDRHRANENEAAVKRLADSASRSGWRQRPAPYPNVSCWPNSDIGSQRLEPIACPYSLASRLKMLDFDTHECFPLGAQ